MRRTFLIFLTLSAVFGFSALCQAQSFLQNEAGISAFCKLNTVNLAQAATAYRNIEYQTAEYMIGSVAIENYPESDDVHVYLHSSGDMIAYYLKQEKVSKIVDWKSYYLDGVLNGSKLETALKKVASAMGQSPIDVQYYDYRFPEANSLKIVLDEARNETETFRIMIPGSCLVFDRSFSHAVLATGEGTASGTLKLNEVILNTGSISGSDNWHIVEGEITAAQLETDEYHTFSIENNDGGWGHVAVILLYQAP